MSNNPFEDFIKFVTDNHGEENWITVYKYKQTPYFIYTPHLVIILHK